MKSYKYSLLYSTIAILFLSYTVGAAVLPKFSNNGISQNSVNDVNVPKGTAYTITIPGKEVSPGKFAPAKIYHIPRLAPSEYIHNSIIVKTKQSASLSNDSKSLIGSGLMNILNSLGIKDIRQPFSEYSHSNLQSADKYGLSRIFEINYSSPVDPYDICKELIQNSDVEYAVPVYIHNLYAFTPNDPYFSQQFHLLRTKCNQAWDVSKGDKNVKIAIIDTGVDWQHEDLNANIWTNPDEIPNNNIDDDGSGKIDDVRGWDFVGNITYQQAVSGQYQEDNDPTNNQQYHGTHVAGLASAVTNNGKGVAGSGFNCSIIPIKCASDNAQAGGVFRGYEAILYASRLGADVINCSWGGPGSSPYEQDVVNQATDGGAVVVVSSGNDGQNIDDGGQYPAGYDNVMAVGSSESNDRYSTWGNFGNSVTTYTPGNGVISTLPGNQYYALTGTSMSSPIAAGIVGLTRSVHKNMTPRQIIRQIHSTSDNVLTTNPAQRYLYYGRANAYNAVIFNNPEYPSNKIPGLLASDITIESSDRIRTFDPTTIEMKLTNYLAPANNLKVTVASIQDHLDVIESDVAVGSLGTMESRDINVVVKVNKALIPWFNGIVNILLTYESDNYIDYQLIRIPLELPTKNQFYAVANFQGAPLLWNNARSPSKDVIWTVGNVYQQGDTIGVSYNNTRNTELLKIDANNLPAWCVYAFDANTAFAGGGVGTTTIYNTINAGNNWLLTDATNITPFINEIYFYDQNIGYAFGDPTPDRVWGIGKTTDGGDTWTKITGVPTPNSSETGLVGCYNFINDHIWFGTTRGRMFHSSDRGQTWNASVVYSSGNVTEVCFTDENNGVAIYTEGSDFQSNKMLASTTDGGATWTTGVFNFSALGFYPAYMYNIPDTKIIAVMMSSGEVYATSDYGITWFTILTMKYGSVHTGFGIRSQTGVRLWQAGSGVAYLDINDDLNTNNVIKEISSVAGNEIFFGNIEKFNDTLINVGIKNSGNAQVNFDSIYVEPGTGSSTGEFSVSKIGLPKGVGIFQTISIRVRFIPDTTAGVIGERTAKLVILSNADSPKLEILLKGNIIESPSAVPEITELDGIIFEPISPNPAGDNADFRFYLPSGSKASVQIFNSIGELIANIPDRMYSSGFNNINLNTASYNAGIYYCVLKVGKSQLYRKFVVNR